ncbi:MAG: hypothetical protein ACJ75Z_13595 [Solirubrobacterales bacterium]
MLTGATDPPKNVDSADLDRLFHGPLEEFTGARNELAKSLRSGGNAAAADWVQGLQKPTRAAWLVNQLAARKPKEVERLLRDGERLRAAQEEMIAGATDREALREAARDEQAAIDSLLKTAEAIGREHAVGPQILTRVGETLQAASSDPEVAEAIRLGRLSKEQRAASVGLVGPATPAAPTRKPKGKEREAADRRARQQRAEKRQAAERKLASAEKRLKRERAALDRARESVEEREGKVHAAELDVNAARRALDEV